MSRFCRPESTDPNRIIAFGEDKPVCMKQENKCVRDCLDQGCNDQAEQAVSDMFGKNRLCYQPGAGYRCALLGGGGGVNGAGGR